MEVWRDQQMMEEMKGGEIEREGDTHTHTTHTHTCTHHTHTTHTHTCTHHTHNTNTYPFIDISPLFSSIFFPNPIPANPVAKDTHFLMVAMATILLKDASHFVGVLLCKMLLGCVCGIVCV